MGIKKYFFSKNSSKNLSPNFTVGEFACSGYDTILIDDRLPSMLQRIRNHFGGKIIIISGYRDPVYNIKIGSGDYSLHPKGQAVDIIVYNKGGTIVSGKIVCCYAQSINVLDIGAMYHMGNATHLGYGNKRQWYDESRGVGSNAKFINDWFRYFNISKDIFTKDENIYHKGVMVTDGRVYSKPNASTGTHIRSIKKNYQINCYGTSKKDRSGRIWWAIDSSRKEWVCETHFKVIN